MGKIGQNVHRKDSYPEDHAHKVSEGAFTGGMIPKPNKDRTFPHTHLYEHDGKTLETGVAPDAPGHTHDFKPEDIIGSQSETGPAVPVDKGTGKPIPRERNDSGDRKAYQGKHSYMKR